MPNAEPSPVKVIVHIFRHGERPLESHTAGELTLRGEQQGDSRGVEIAQGLSKSRKRLVVIQGFTSPVSRNEAFLKKILSGFKRQMARRGRKFAELPVQRTPDLKYAQTRDPKTYEQKYAKMDLNRFTRRWLDGKVPARVVEPPHEAMARFYAHVEKTAAGLAQKYRGQPVELHLAMVSHGDLLQGLREDIARRKAKKVGFAERFSLIHYKGTGRYQSKKSRRPLARTPVRRR